MKFPCCYGATSPASPNIVKTNVEENRSLSDSWKRFTKFTPLQETPPKGFLCSQATRASIEASNKVPKTKHACMVEAHEPTKQRVEPSVQQNHEDHMASKGKTLDDTSQFVTNDEDPGCKGSGGQGMQEA